MDITNSDIILAKEAKHRLYKFKEFEFDEYNCKIFPHGSQYLQCTSTKLRIDRHTFFPLLSNKSLDEALKLLCDILKRSATSIIDMSSGRSYHIPEHEYTAAFTQLFESNMTPDNSINFIQNYHQSRKECFASLQNTRNEVPKSDLLNTTSFAKKKKFSFNSIWISPKEMIYVQNSVIDRLMTPLPYQIYKTYPLISRVISYSIYSM
eukprot:NODE_961_length_2881_cov_0.321352.p1 type:complete len:207 gc:universal NODE_961_length_2881_cov_0.321352:930-310(-)